MKNYIDQLITTKSKETQAASDLYQDAMRKMMANFNLSTELANTAWGWLGASIEPAVHTDKDSY
jgi:hypothetical protein